MSETGKIQSIPVRSVIGHWDPYSDSEDAELVEITKANGRQAVYQLVVPNPHPRFVESLELIRMMKENTYGGYKAKHNKNDR